VPKASKRRRLCPEGVEKRCLFCVESEGRSWHVLDPDGEVVDESSSKKDAIQMAESYISQCVASKSGYGVVKFDAKRGPWQQVVIWVVGLLVLGAVTICGMLSDASSAQDVGKVAFGAVLVLLGFGGGRGASILQTKKNSKPPRGKTEYRYLNRD
jgi:hypothetical protein